ncbi:MAG: purine-binding chemotaxis protein CheW [Desulfobacterales bacterium]|nr:purine-binding chemotaxis protein CheW [Desulfobacterales bacterium]
MTNDSLNEQKNFAKNKDFIQVVTFKLHTEEYAIEITKVKEIIWFKGVTRIPQVPEFIEGIINLRGNIIPVIDLRKRFNLSKAERNDQTRIMITRMETKIIGLIVDSVSEVMKINKSQIQEPPETIASLAGEYLLGIGKVKDRMITLLDIEKILSASEKDVIRLDKNKIEQIETKNEGE